MIKYSIGQDVFYFVSSDTIVEAVVQGTKREQVSERTIENFLKIDTVWYEQAGFYSFAELKEELDKLNDMLEYIQGGLDRECVEISRRITPWLELLFASRDAAAETIKEYNPSEKGGVNE